MSDLITTPAESPRRRRKSVRPAEILQAAITLFVERGFAATRTEDIAKAAGVSKGTVFLYYPNKEAIIRELLEQTVVPMVRYASSTTAQSDDDPEQLLRTIVQHWWSAFGDTSLAGISKLIMAESGNFPDLARFYLDTVVLPSQAMVSQVIARGQAQGVFRQDIEPLIATQVLFSPFLHRCQWKHSLGKFCQEFTDSNAYLEQALSLLLDGLRASPRAAPTAKQDV